MIASHSARAALTKDLGNKLAKHETDFGNKPEFGIILKFIRMMLKSEAAKNRGIILTMFEC